MNEQNYGFAFNSITITHDTFQKTAKNKHGQIKISHEIAFYKYIIQNNIQFPIPRLIHCKEDTLILEYIRNADTLTNKINATNVYEYIHRIRTYLSHIHSIRIPVSVDTIKKDTIIEIEQKVISRFNEFDWGSNTLYNSIHSVNHIKIKSLFEYCHIIKDKIMGELCKRDHYSIIHGDIHLGNILVDESDNIVFIDPRGYFGESELYGLPEYDYAKLLFGLSGYSVFDNMSVDELLVENNNINIDFIKEHEYIFERNIFDTMSVLFCLSIWLANNSCFTNVNKKIMSLLIACYYCEKYVSGI